MQTKTLGVTVSRKSSSGQIAGFGIYPNPSAQDKLYLAFSSERPIDAQWRVLSLDGREVATGKFQSTTGTNRQELKLDNLPAGVWFVELQLENGRLQVLPWVKL